MAFVRPDVEAFLTFLNAQPGPRMHEVEPAMARQMMLAMKPLAELPRGDLANVEDIAIDSPHGHRIPLRIYRPSAGTAPASVLVFYHGGGWVIGDLETHDPLCAEIARGLDITVVAVDYRLAPEHRFPAAGEDCLAATRWIASSPREIGHAVTSLVVAGDSAGGNMAAIVAQELAGKLPVPIIAQWLIYPGVDMTADGGSMHEFADGYLLTAEGMAWFSRHYLGDFGDLTDRRASPLHHDALEGQPAALVFTCGLDPLRDQGRAYAAKLIAAGVPTVFREAAGQIHGCMNLRQAIPSAQGDLAGCLSALREIINEAGADMVMASAARAAAE
jgi:acetyl esterase